MALERAGRDLEQAAVSTELEATSSAKAGELLRLGSRLDLHRGREGPGDANSGAAGRAPRGWGHLSPRNHHQLRTSESPPDDNRLCCEQWTFSQSYVKV